MRVYNFVMRVAFCERENFVADIKSKVDLIEILVFWRRKRGGSSVIAAKTGSLTALRQIRQ